MALVPEYPPILRGNLQEQITQLREYLFRLAGKQATNATASDNSRELADVAFSGSYNDLKDKPAIGGAASLKRGVHNYTGITVAGASVHRSFDVSLEGYTPIGVIGFYSNNPAILLAEARIVGNDIVYTLSNIRGIGSVAIDVQFTVLYMKD